VPKSPEKGKDGHDRHLTTVDGIDPVRNDGHRAPRTISAPSNRVTIAFPFSQIKTEEASKELSQLAALVCDLVETIREWVPEERLEDLRTRAEGLRDRLR
jgi:hypothetical protein